MLGAGMPPARHYVLRYLDSQELWTSLSRSVSQRQAREAQLARLQAVRMLLWTSPLIFSLILPRPRGSG
jgi:hypothetical protein